MAVPQTFWVQTLGCRTNGADSDRITAILRRRGLALVHSPESADIRVLNTCSVTTPAAAQSRQTARKLSTLTVLQPASTPETPCTPELLGTPSTAAKLIVSGCWATSNTSDASAIPGVDVVITHRDSLDQRLNETLTEWGVPLNPPVRVSLTQFGEKTTPSRQRAYLKVQDGCDAHCTYCIIPKLRSELWSIDPANAVSEVRDLVASGHKEVVLTGIFLGATGQTTALRRRQERQGGTYLAELVSKIAAEVPELPRLRLSSLEPGDLNDELLSALVRSHQVVPHFHLPLQSGSDAILRRMNRQYSQADFLALIDRLTTAFDRPALTTDILTGFPGETDADFDETLRVVDHARFLHVHAFPFSPRPGTAAARWTKDFVSGAIANARSRVLRERSAEHALAFRKSFLDEKATVIIEASLSESGNPHGRCERYFDIEIPGMPHTPGAQVTVRVAEVSPETTLGVRVGAAALPVLQTKCQ